MLARGVRSGLTESYHDGAIAVLGADGEMLLEVGDVDRPYFYRSAVKPFQATISLEAGLTLSQSEIAVAGSSHGGQEIHRALVSAILSGAGLEESALRCPPGWPLSLSARLELAAAGETTPRPIYHNCSGKHAAALAACVRAGWPVDSYLDPDHPYQRRARDLVAEVSGETVEPVGVDGCGYPTLRGTTRGLARAFAHLAFDDRFAPVRSAMMAQPALTCDAHRPETALMESVPAAVKGGAVACAGLAMTDRFGLGAKCWDGSNRALYVGVIEALERLDVLDSAARDRLVPHARPAILGGGQPVGHFEPAL